MENTAPELQVQPFPMPSSDLHAVERTPSTAILEKKKPATFEESVLRVHMAEASIKIKFGEFDYVIFPQK